MSAEVPSREVFWNVDHEWIMYVCMAAALGAFAFCFIRRMRLWKAGRPVERTDNACKRLEGTLKDAFLQLRVVRKRGVGAMHVAMYASMLILLVATASYAAYIDLGLDIVSGNFYLYFLALTVDLAGLAFCLAMVGCIVRRILKRDTLESTMADYAVLVFLLAVGVSGFVVEALRIVGTNDPWAAWSPVGYALSLAFSGMNASAVEALHQVFWWGHMALAFALIAYWAYSKLVHVFLIPAAVYCRDLRPRGTLDPIDFEDESLDVIGAGVAADLTWKDLLDAQACVGCNRCVESCPANLSGKALSPKELMQRLNAGLEAHPGAAGEVRLVGDVVSEEALWACTTCASCTQHCPSHLEHPIKIARMRTYQVSMESAFPQEAQAMFRNLENNGNPWGLGWRTREKWAEALGVPTLTENPDAEYLYWPGCSGALDARGKKVSAAVVALLRSADVSFAILGNEEKCCGDSARRLGNEYVYYLLAQENIETLNAYGVKKIVTQCPHCLQVLSRDYPQMGGCFEVVHHTELLASLVAQGRLKGLPQEEARSSSLVAFHDSCYLGRYRGLYDEPRTLIAASGHEVVECSMSREDALCCGAGGGRMWLEEPQEHRVSVLRSEQVLATGAKIAATACPFCLSMLSDGLSGLDDQVVVKDVAELLLEAQADSSIQTA